MSLYFEDLPSTMVDVEGDILVEIPDGDLPKLAEIYEKHQDWYPQGYSIINTGIEWKKKSKGQLLTFLSPNNCWKEDGTFFVILKIDNFDLHIYSLDKSGRNVYDGITKTKRIIIDYSLRSPLVYCLHNILYQIVKKAITDKNLEILEEDRCNIYAISKEKALQFDTTCPPELYIKRLEQKHAFKVNADWPNRYKKSESYISLLIEMNESYGVFLKSNGELVSWAVLSLMGQLTMVQTAEGHMKKGYASLVTKFASKEIAKKGHNAVGTIKEANTPSLKMFEKLGFRNIGACDYILFT